MIRVRLISVAMFFVFSMASVRAADIIAFFPVSMEHTAHDVIPAFEKSTGHKVLIQFGTAGAVAGKVRAGETADVLISTAAQIDALIKEGKLVAGSNTGMAKVGVGVLVRKGAAKPDISTVENLKAAILAAKGIAYTDPALGGPAGIYVAKMLDQLGIGAEMKSRTKLAGPGAAVSTAVVNGEAELGFIMINEILADKRVDHVGALPPAIQDYTRFAIGQVASGSQREAGSALIKLMSSSETRQIMQGLGFEPY